MPDLDDNILELRDIIAERLEQPVSPDDGSGTACKIWAYMGTCGGAGTTSIAVQAAYSLATMHETKKSKPESTLSKKRVCLVDLDFERSSVSAYLDITPEFTIEDLNASSGRMDDELCMFFVENYANTFSVVSACGELGGNDEASAGAVMTLLDQLSGKFDYIIIDVPMMWRPMSKAVISAVDKFALVTVLSVPSLHYARMLSKNIMQELKLDARPKMIINKYERRNFRNSLNLKDAAKVLGSDDIIELSVDDETLSQAINRGTPAGKIKPTSKFVKSMCAHVVDWAQIERRARPRVEAKQA